MNLSVEKKNNFTEIIISVDKFDDQIPVMLKLKLFATIGAGEKNIVLNVMNCAECNPSGFSALLAADRLCRSANGIFIVTGINESVYQLLQVARLDQVLNFADSPEAAYEMVESLSRA